jgi:DNA repair exonuclease SbcCD ATPase subunit
VIPVRLIIEDFFCHGRSEIDFTQFNSALIVGKLLGNDSYSNGVGKSTIFKAIEYVLFNQSDSNLDKIIRDDAYSCKVILYFNSDNNFYRLSRSRNKKGISDLSLHIRTTNFALDENIFVDTVDKDSVVWRNISGRRTADTELDLQKLIKINYKIFRNTSHFVQNDMAGLATLTPERRKSLLKDVFQLLVYSKLEKIAKDECALLVKENQKIDVMLESLQNLESIINNNDKELIINKNLLDSKNREFDLANSDLSLINEDILSLDKHINSIESKSQLIQDKKISLVKELSKIEKDIQNISIKKNGILSEEDSIMKIICEARESIDKLSDNSDKLKEFEQKLSLIKEQILLQQVNIKNYLSEIEELKIPLPKDSICKYCRQPLSDEYRISCQKEINNKIIYLETLIKEAKSLSLDLTRQQNYIYNSIIQIEKDKKQISLLNETIISNEKLLETKKTLYEEYNNIFLKYQKDLDNKKVELSDIEQQLLLLNSSELFNLKNKLSDLNSKKNEILAKIASLNKEITHISNNIAVLSHTLDQKKADLIKRDNLIKSKKELCNKIENYNLVIEAFSSTGIPNLIVHNVLDDLQNECNDLLSKIRPGLQLSFIIEKERDNGTQDDTLDIKYYLNNRERDFDQLSGAQKISVSFALKLGLSFLLQKMFDVEIKLLLLDEIDQSLDKIGVDAFADIVNIFKKDFKILVITHNDRLKDKFSHAIIVNQDSSGVSYATVSPSW